MTKTFSQLSTELDMIIDKLQSSELDIDEAIIEYEKACKYIDQLQTQLEKAEVKVKKLKKDFS